MEEVFFAIILRKPSEMFYLLLCILSSSVVLITFKFAERFQVNSFSAIVVNYLTACLAGFFLANGKVSLLTEISPSNVIFMVLLGLLYIGTFNLMGASTRRAGVAITSVASKMSVIFPILFSVWIDSSDKLTFTKVLGIAIALVSVFLITYRKGELKSRGFDKYLPVLIFIGIGVIDSATKYAQMSFVTNDMNPVFNLATFGVAGVAGLLVLPFNSEAKQDLKRAKSWILGAILGLANFGSMFFMIRALNSVSSSGLALQGSILFGINSVGIVLICVLAGLLFNEKPTKLNWLGFALSIVTIFVLAFSADI